LAEIFNIGLVTVAIAKQYIDVEGMPENRRTPQNTAERY